MIALLLALLLQPPALAEPSFHGTVSQPSPSKHAPVEIKAPGNAGFAPASFRIRVRIEPDERNRKACVGIDAESFYRSSCWDVDGDSAPTTWVDYRDVPAGEFVIVAALVRSDGSVARATATITVLSNRF